MKSKDHYDRKIKEIEDQLAANSFEEGSYALKRIAPKVDGAAKRREIR